MALFLGVAKHKQELLNIGSKDTDVGTCASANASWQPHMCNDTVYCKFIYICIYVYIHVYVRIYIYILRIYTYIYICIFTYISSFTFFLNTDIYIYICFLFTNSIDRNIVYRDHWGD